MAENIVPLRITTSEGLIGAVSREADAAISSHRQEYAILHVADQRLRELAHILPEAIRATDGDLRRRLEALAESL